MRYRATMAPASVEASGEKATLRALVRGDFPGSPVTLAFHFTLVPDGIAALEVTP